MCTFAGINVPELDSRVVTSSSKDGWEFDAKGNAKDVTCVPFQSHHAFGVKTERRHHRDSAHQHQ